MAIYTPRKRLVLLKNQYQYGQTPPHMDDFSDGKLYFMGIICSLETTGYHEPLRVNTARFDPTLVDSPPYPMTWCFWPYYSDGNHQFFIWVNVGGTPTRYGVSFNDAIWNSTGTTRIFEVVWDRANNRLISFTNGKYAYANTNANLANDLWDTADSIMRIGRSPNSFIYLSVKHELLIIDNKFPWWYNPAETIYHRMDHILYLDPDNPIPLGTEPGDPSQYLHCYLFNDDANDYGSNPQHFTLYNNPTFETGLAGNWMDIIPPDPLIATAWVNCSKVACVKAPYTFIFNAQGHGGVPPYNYEWWVSTDQGANWELRASGSSTFEVTMVSGGPPIDYWVKVKITDSQTLPAEAWSEIVKVGTYIDPLDIEIAVDNPAGIPPHTANFTSTTTGGVPGVFGYSYLWQYKLVGSPVWIDFDTPGVANPTQIFTNPGIYEVHCIAEDSLDTTDESNILILEISYPEYHAAPEERVEDEHEDFITDEEGFAP